MPFDSSNSFGLIAESFEIEFLVYLKGIQNYRRYGLYLFIIICAVRQEGNQLVAGPFFSQCYGNSFEPPHAIESQVGVLIFELVSAHANSG